MADDIVTRLMSDITAMEKARTEIVRLRAEVERLRAAGDALAQQLSYWKVGHSYLADKALDAWQEARRG